jgi:hypothetical protein
MIDLTNAETVRLVFQIVSGAKKFLSRQCQDIKRGIIEEAS